MDLQSKNVKNVAIYYLRKKMSEKYVGDNKNMILLAEKKCVMMSKIYQNAQQNYLMRKIYLSNE